MDVVYSIIESKFSPITPTKNLFIIFPGVQYFLPVVAVITLLAVLWHYRGGLEGSGAAEYDELHFEDDGEFK